MVAKGIFGKSYANTVIKEFDVGIVSTDEVVVNVKSSLLCGTDVQFLKYSTEQFRAIGHETSGIVVDVGKNVKDIAIGDIVAIKPSIPCKMCQQCKLGNEQYCQNIICYDNMPGFSNYVKVSSRAIFKTTGLSYDEAASLEILASAIKIVNACDILNCNIAVIGTGPLGILVAKVAQVFGAKFVTVIGNKPCTIQSVKRHQMLIDFEIDRVITYDEINDEKFDCIIDVAPKANIQFDAMHCEVGGTIILAGITFCQDATNIINLPDIVFNKLMIRCILSDPKSNFEDAEKLILDKTINVARLITDYCDLSSSSRMIENVVNKNTPTVKLCFHNN